MLGGVRLRHFDKGTLLILAGVAFLGSNTPFAKLAYQHGMTAPTLLLIRYALTIAVLGSILLLRKVPLAAPGPAGRGALLHGAFLVGTSFGYLGSIQFLPLSLAVLILYTMTAWTVLFGHWLGMDRLTPAKSAAVLLAVAGVGLIVGADFGRLHSTGIALALAGSVCFALVTTAGKRASRLTDPMLVNVYAAAMGLPAAIVIGLLLGNLVVPGGIALAATLTSSMLYILGFSFVLAGIKQTVPSRAGVTMALEPFLTVLGSILMLGEPFSRGMLLGGALVFTAVALVNFRIGSKREPLPAAD